jgi:hypothetical protein
MHPSWIGGKMKFAEVCKIRPAKSRDNHVSFAVRLRKHFTVYKIIMVLD